MKQVVVKITCDVKDLLAPDKLTPLQGELKSLTEKKYEKLKASLLRHGFVFPEYVWKNGKTNYVTDGHQRLRALSKMKEEGIELEGGKVPIVYVHAENKKHAMELILAAMSEYGTYDEDSVYAFVNMAGLDWKDVKPFSDFAALNMGTLEYGWFKHTEIEDPQKGWQGMPEYDHQDKAPVRSIMVHFASIQDVENFAQTIGQNITEKTRSIWIPKSKNLDTKSKYYE